MRPLVYFPMGHDRPRNVCKRYGCENHTSAPDVPCRPCQRAGAETYLCLHPNSDGSGLCRRVYHVLPGEPIKCPEDGSRVAYRVKNKVTKLLLAR